MRTGLIAGAALATLLALGATTMIPAGIAAPPPRPDPFVTTSWLAGHLNDPDLVLLHVGDETRYKAAHIPGAHFVRLADLSVSTNGRTLEMPVAPDLRRRLQALGIGDRSRVVVYFDEDWVSPATRVLFTLQTAGLGSRAELLDGGMVKWRSERRAVTARIAAAPPGALAALGVRPTIVDAAFVRAHAGQTGYMLIDARAPVFYTGIEAGGPMNHRLNGHIPGARSLPFTSVTNDDLTFKKPAELFALFRNAGMRPGDRVIVYCHIGQQGTAVVLAARAAGIDALLYDGSFEDWALRGLPVEK